MATKKITLKTARRRRGTVSRAAIRKAVETVLAASREARSVKVRARIPQAQ